MGPEEEEEEWPQKVDLAWRIQNDPPPLAKNRTAICSSLSVSGNCFWAPRWSINDSV